LLNLHFQLAQLRRIQMQGDALRSLTGIGKRQQLVGDLLPEEGDFLAIIIDALGGNDLVNGGGGSEQVSAGCRDAAESGGVEPQTK